MSVVSHDAAHQATLESLIAMEHELMDPAVRADPDQVLDYLHEDFEEVGKSGRHWHRDAIADALAGDPGKGSETSQVDASFLSEHVVLITYAARTLDDDHCVSRRVSVWVCEHGTWLLRYHQGTRAA